MSEDVNTNQHEQEDNSMLLRQFQRGRLAFIAAIEHSDIIPSDKQTIEGAFINSTLDVGEQLMEGKRPNGKVTYSSIMNKAHDDIVLALHPRKDNHLFHQINVAFDEARQVAESSTASLGDATARVIQGKQSSAKTQGK